MKVWELAADLLQYGKPYEEVYVAIIPKGNRCPKPDLIAESVSTGLGQHSRLTIWAVREESCDSKT